MIEVTILSPGPRSPCHTIAVPCAGWEWDGVDGEDGGSIGTGGLVALHIPLGALPGFRGLVASLDQAEYAKLSPPEQVERLGVYLLSSLPRGAEIGLDVAIAALLLSAVRMWESAVPDGHTKPAATAATIRNLTAAMANSLPGYQNATNGTPG
jgi:hypothetical protein